MENFPSSADVDGLIRKIQTVGSRLSKDQTEQLEAEPAAAPPRFQYLDLPKDAFAGETPDSGGLLEYWQVLRRYKGTVLRMAVLCTVAGFLISLPQTPIYQASTTIEIQAPNENFLNMRDVDPTTSTGSSTVESYVETQVKILESESLIDRVAAKLALEDRPEFAPRGLDFSTWRRRLGLPPRPPLPARQRVREIVLKNLKVRQSRTNRIVEILYDSPDPQFAAEFVNTLVDEFIQQSVEVRFQATRRTGDWLAQQLADLRIKLVESERKLQRYARASDLLFTSEKDSVAETKMRQLQDELSKAQAERVTRQSYYERAAASPPESLPEVLDSTALRDYQAKLAELRRQVAELRPSFKPAHYKMERLESQVAELEATLHKERANIISRVRNEYESALRREQLLAAAYDAQARQVSEQAGKAIYYNTLRREVDTNRQLYESMLQKVNEARIISAMRASNIRLVDAALPPVIPYKPNVGLNSLLGLLSGICLAVGFVLIRERADHMRESADRSIRAPGDSPTYLCVPELGVIPSGGEDTPPATRLSIKLRMLLGSAGAKNGNGDEAGVELVTWQQKPSFVAESFRAALTSILFSAQKVRRPRVIVVTSPSPEEGKTTAVSNLGIALAEIQGRVLLIDGDLRKPRLNHVFDVANDWGLNDLLQGTDPIGDYPLEALAVETKIPGLYVLPSGAPTCNISYLLHSSRLPQLLRRLRQEFRMVLIDSPPVLPIPDARILARFADSVVLVFRAGQTTHEAALAATRRFAEDGRPVLGTILNDWDPSTADRSYYAHYDHYLYGKPETA